MNRVVTIIGCVLFAAYDASAQQPLSLSNSNNFASSASAKSGAAARIGVEDFGTLPFMTNPKLTPDGKQVAAQAVLGGKEYVVVLDLLPSAVAHRISVPENYDLNWYRWAGNNRLLISLGQATRVLAQDVYSTRLEMYDLVTKKSTFIGKRYEGIDGDTVIYVDREGQWLLLSIQETFDDYPSVWRVNLNSMAMDEVVSQQANVWSWYADTNGVVRAGLGSADNRWWLLYRKSADEKFRKVVKRKISKDDEDSSIEKFIPTDGGDLGYAIANKNTGRYGLYHYDFANDVLGDAVFEHPTVDIDDFRQAENGEIEAIYYTDDRRRIEWLDPKMKELQGNIDKAIPGRINRVTSKDKASDRMIVWTGSASDPGRYYLYQVGTGTLSLLSKPYEKIADRQLAVMESTTYRARDGLEIPAYLTLPFGIPAHALPLIVMPHGGPFVRDEWGYDPYVQFLANRGYAVLQPNYRGSTGYGKVFVEKGMGQWGRGMQDDLDDGVKWLVEQGKVDPKRVCIMGASYGGYAAMWAAARGPEIYRCAISLAGISDVPAMLKYDQKTFAAPRYFRNWRERVQGDKHFDLNTISPLQVVNQIRVPLLIAHGEKDDNVPMSQSKRLHEALLKADKPHEYVVYPGERHGFQKPENSIDYLKRVEAFLNKYNPAE